MTQRELEALVERWRLFLVPEWDVHVDFDGELEEPHDLADVTWSVHYHRATLRLRSDVAAGSARDGGGRLRDAEVSVVHELLHLVLRDSEWVIREQLVGLLHRDTQALVEGDHAHAIEAAVERLAFALVALARGATP